MVTTQTGKRLTVEFKKLSEEASVPERAHPTDAGYDLRAAESLVLGPGERSSVGTGIAVAIPVYHAGLVMPRSGLALKRGITIPNSPGLIDPDYRGEVRVIMLNTDKDQPFSIEVGDRIAQLMIVPIESVELEERDQLDSTPRGDGGFGSTGV